MPRMSHCIIRCDGERVGDNGRLETGHSQIFDARIAALDHLGDQKCVWYLPCAS
jgi:hypothetical protein